MIDLYEMMCSFFRHNINFILGESSGIVVEDLKPNREVLGLTPSGGTVLCS